MQQQQQFNDISDIFGSSGGELLHTEVPPILPWSLPPVDVDPFFLAPPPPSSYGGLFVRRPPELQFPYDHGQSSGGHLRIISEALGSSSMGTVPFGLQAELSGKMTAQEIMDAKALAASRSHSEAERRRRERINNHLAKLRTLLPNTTKTDKASLLAEVIQHVKELKRQTSIIAETSLIPTEMDELTMDTTDEDGRVVIRASLSCEDRSDLLPDLIKTLKALRLRTVRAELITVGGRVKNVLFIAGEEEAGDDDSERMSIGSVEEALRAVMEKTSGEECSSGSAKRQRTNGNTSVLERRSL